MLLASVADMPRLRPLAATCSAWRSCFSVKRCFFPLGIGVSFYEIVLQIGHSGEKMVYVSAWGAPGSKSPVWCPCHDRERLYLTCLGACDQHFQLVDD